MATTRDCPECGAPLDDQAPLGLCPRCIMRLGMHRAKNTNDGALASSTDATAGSAIPIDSPPELEILEPLGRGGMGVVYKARQKKLDRLVALKLIRPESANDPAFAERFSREARAMARLNHPNIVTVHDFGETGGLCYLVMELVEGVDLRGRIKSGPLEPKAALLIAIQICDALEYAHARGVIHRDIKPENILLDSLRGVRIADFGLAKLLLPGSDLTLTATQHVLGSPHYMAPESLDGSRQIDHRSDIFSLGVVLYEMLTGELPLGRYELPSETVGTDEHLDDFLEKALARKPSDRYDSVDALRHDLVEFAEGYELPDLRSVITETIGPEIEPSRPRRSEFGADWSKLVALARWLFGPGSRKGREEEL
jgi:serine/threonine protein kinase